MMDERIVSLRGAIATKQSRAALQPARMRSCFALRIKEIASLPPAMTEKKKPEGESIYQRSIHG